MGCALVALPLGGFMDKMRNRLLIFIIINIPIMSFGQSNYEKERSHILTAFAKYITLNREFISTVNSGNNQKYVNARNRVEAFGEDSLSLALQKYRIILIEQPDTVMIRVLCDLIIETENSAYEEPHWRVGETYLNYPEILESIINEYDKKSKTILIQSISFGFQNVLYGKARNSRIDSLENRIISLEKFSE